MRTSEEIIDYLNKIRQEQNVSISELARRVGMAKSGVSRYFNHTRKFPINRVPRFAKALHITDVNDILGTKPDNTVSLDGKKSKCIPLVGTIMIDKPITAEENVEGYIPEFFLDDVKTNELFYLKCKDHSMEPTIPDGAIALIHEQSNVKDDEIAAVVLDDDNIATLKRIQHIKGGILLIPDNHNYKSIVVDKNNPGRILGKLVEYKVCMK